jgi:hypothetical protein
MLIVTFVIGGWIAFYVAVRRMLAQNSARLRQEFWGEINALAARPEPAQPPAAQSAHASVSAIAAAAAVLATTKVHVRPVKPAQTRPVGDPWAQQGRAGVWSAHDLAQRWH